MKFATKQLITILFTLSLMIVVLSSCSQPEESNGRLQIIATTGQITDIVENVAGDHVDLTNLFGPGIDPHLYVPTEGDVSTLGQADIIFYNGLYLEAQMERVMAQFSQSKTVVSIGDSLPEDQLIQLQDNYPYDPHIWNDPELWKLATDLVRDTLVQADPDNADSYRANADSYKASIEAADAYVREQINLIPADKRIMVTAHDAFGYFARAYGLEVRGLQAISTQTEAGTQDVQALAQFIVERQLPAIFVESSVPADTIEAVKTAVQSQGFNVTIGGELFSDALAEEGHEASTYTGMLRYNARTLAEALGQ